MPERIGRYDVLLPIASGGMGAVYLARARGAGGFEREVAIKLLHAHLKESESFASDLIEEAKLTVRIRHPNVVSIIDVGDDPFGMFIVMDYIEGDTLSGLRRRATKAGQRLPLRIGLRVLVDALAGLHAAHELRDEKTGILVGVVHRDFSPQNVLIGIDGVGRLADFGIAKATTQTSHTATGIVKGKISYMSPEQARGEPIDRRCDVWAAGVVAWELVTGRPLHSADKGVGALFKIATEAPPRLKAIVPDVAPEIDEAVALALTPDLALRCKTAAQFKLALVNACRASQEMAESEEVAEYVIKLVGPMLGERRVRVSELAELRKRMGQFTVPVDAGTPQSHSVQEVAVVEVGTHVDDDDATHVVVEDAAVAASAPAGAALDATEVEEKKRVVVVPTGADVPAEKTTDATAVSTAGAKALVSKPRIVRTPWAVGIGVGVAAAALATGLVVHSRTTSSSAELPGPVTAVSSSSPAAPSASAEPSVPPPTAAEPPPPPIESVTPSYAPVHSASAPPAVRPPPARPVAAPRPPPNGPTLAPKPHF